MYICMMMSEAVGISDGDMTGLSAAEKEEQEDALIAALPRGGRAFLGKISNMLIDLGMEQGAQVTGEPLESPAMGTNISKDLFEKTVTILRRYYEFEAPDSEPEPPAAKRSRLRRNDVVKEKVVTMPVDVECEERFIKAADETVVSQLEFFSYSEEVSIPYGGQYSPLRQSLHSKGSGHETKGEGYSDRQGTLF